MEKWVYQLRSGLDTVTWSCCAGLWMTFRTLRVGWLITLHGMTYSEMIGFTCYTPQDDIQWYDWVYWLHSTGWHTIRGLGLLVTLHRMTYNEMIGFTGYTWQDDLKWWKWICWLHFTRLCKMRSGLADYTGQDNIQWQSGFADYTVQGDLKWELVYWLHRTG